MDREAWRAIGHGIAKSRTQMSDYPARSFLQPPMFPAETWGPHPAEAEVRVESGAGSTGLPVVSSGAGLPLTWWCDPHSQPVSSPLSLLCPSQHLSREERQAAETLPLGAGSGASGVSARLPPACAHCRLK